MNLLIILVDHVYINRFGARLDFVGPKTKPLEVVKVRNFIMKIWDIYTSIPTKSTMADHEDDTNFCDMLKH